MTERQGGEGHTEAHGPVFTPTLITVTLKHVLYNLNHLFEY